jgi:cardiolipin synthase
VNLDKRSFRLNFEITAIVLGSSFAQDVHEMFIRDFEKSHEVSVSEVQHMPIWLRITSQLAHLLAPIQ